MIIALSFALWSDSNPIYASLRVSPSNRTTISAGFTHSKQHEGFTHDKEEQGWDGKLDKLQILSSSQTIPSST